MFSISVNDNDCINDFKETSDEVHGLKDQSVEKSVKNFLHNFTNVSTFNIYQELSSITRARCVSG